MLVGTIQLSILKEGAIKLTNFMVLNILTSYNEILGRTWIYRMKIFPSMYHQLIKYPTMDGVKEIRGKQKKVKSCYNFSMKNAIPCGPK